MVRRCQLILMVPRLGDLCSLLGEIDSCRWQTLCISDPADRFYRLVLCREDNVYIFFENFARC
jgi:hypothetical protein